jgi:hypothetical protein
MKPYLFIIICVLMIIVFYIYYNPMKESVDSMIPDNNQIIIENQAMYSNDDFKIFQTYIDFINHFLILRLTKIHFSLCQDSQIIILKLSILLTIF